jgi:hypothetical protein
MRHTQDVETVGSNPTFGTIAFVAELVRASRSKREILSVRIRPKAPSVAVAGSVRAHRLRR